MEFVQLVLGGKRTAALYEQFVEQFTARTAALHIGQPLDEQTEIGPLISNGQRQRSLDYLALGQREGARIVAGGMIPIAVSDGYFLQSTILSQVDNGIRVAQDEIFGPVVCIIPFRE